MSYPVILSLKGRHCIVVGLGQVGLRKLQGILAQGVGSVLALDVRSRAELDPRVCEMLTDKRVTFAQRQFSAADLPCFLLFACTSNDAVNRQIAALCGERGILCNCATTPEAGNFTLPAVARAGEICIAIATQNPYLSRAWKPELQIWAEKRRLAVELSSALRPLVISQAGGAKLLRQIAAGPLKNFVQTGNLDKCLKDLSSLLPQNKEALSHIFANLESHRRP